jgi:hypothetical protein
MPPHYDPMSPHRSFALQCHRSLPLAEPFAKEPRGFFTPAGTPMPGSPKPPAVPFWMLAFFSASAKFTSVSFSSTTCNSGGQMHLLLCIQLLHLAVSAAATHPCRQDDDHDDHLLPQAK